MDSSLALWVSGISFDINNKVTDSYILQFTNCKRFMSAVHAWTIISWEDNPSHGVCHQKFLWPHQQRAWQEIHKTLDTCYVSLQMLSQKVQIPDLLPSFS